MHDAGFNLFLLCLQHKLKSNQRDKVKRFVSFTQTSEQTAVYCLSQHDWKLELASDAYFQNPDIYWREGVGKSAPMVDRRKIDQLFNKYRGMWKVRHFFHARSHRIYKQKCFLFLQMRTKMTK